MNKPKNFDKARAKAFTGKVISDVAGAVTLHLCAIGDRLGLFKDLAENGPTDPEAFAMRTGIDARYAREWLEAMAAAAYVEFDPESSNFTLPPEHARPLADDTNPLFQGALWSMFVMLGGALALVARGRGGHRGRA